MNGPTHEQDDGRSPRYIQSVIKAFELIDVLKERSGATITELTEETSLTKGSVHTHLNTLCSLGYVRKVGDNYNLDLLFIPVSEYVRNQSLLYQEGKIEVDKLANLSKEYVHLTTEFNGGQIALHEARGENAIGTEYYRQMREQPQQIHASSTGKAMLAHMSDERVREIAKNQGLDSLTDNTITSIETLLSEVETVRERGYAVNDGEDISGMRAVGAPIYVKRWNILGSVSITGPKSRIDDTQFHEMIPAKVMQTANIIEVNIETKLVESQP